MARRRFRKGAKCSTKSTMKRIRKVGMRCVCKTATGAWKFQKRGKCRR